jgi:hypothetical protein
MENLLNGEKRGSTELEHVPGTSFFKLSAGMLHFVPTFLPPFHPLMLPVLCVASSTQGKSQEERLLFGRTTAQ